MNTNPGYFALIWFRNGNGCDPVNGRGPFDTLEAAMMDATDYMLSDELYHCAIFHVGVAWDICLKWEAGRANAGKGYSAVPLHLFLETQDWFESYKMLLSEPKGN